MRQSADAKLLVVFHLQKLHHVEEGWRKGVVELLLPIHPHLPQVEVHILCQTHEAAANEDGHVVVAKQDHVSDPVRRIFTALLSPLHE